VHPELGKVVLSCFPFFYRAGRKSDTFTEGKKKGGKKKDYNYRNIASSKTSKKERAARHLYEEKKKQKLKSGKNA